MKKASLSSEKGIKVLEKVFDDIEKVLTALKRLVDQCLTDTKLSSSDSKGRSLQVCVLLDTINYPFF